MLSLSRPTRAASRISLHMRALSAAAQSAGSPNATATTEFLDSSTAPDSTVETRRPKPPWRVNSSVECMFVYPWDGIRSSAEGLAIARAVQDKYGAAKEVIFPRDPDCINVFQPYFWLVFDNPNVRKRLPEKSTQFSVQVEDLPRSDGNVGLEEMMRGLGLPTNENSATLPPSSPAPSEAKVSEDASSDIPSSYKTLQVRIDWAREGPGEVLRRKRPIAASLPKENRLAPFATAWLAFDGFSPESARGPHTPNLLYTRKKWQKLAPEPALDSSSSVRSGHDDLATTAAVPPSQEPVGAGTGPESEPVSASEAQTEQQNVSPPREWVPIIPGGPRRPMPALAASIPKVASTSTPLDPAHTTEAAESHITDDSRATPTTPSATTSSTEQNSEAAAVGHKMSRRERILHLARQNARTPLPEPVEVSQPLAPTEAKTVDEEESERHVKERTIRERLWRLVGGNY